MIRELAKPVEFLGDCLDALRKFPEEPRREAGYQIDRVQRGLEPDDWKPIQTAGQDVALARKRYRELKRLQ